MLEQEEILNKLTVKTSKNSVRMDIAKTIEQEASRQELLRKTTALGNSDIQTFYAGSSIFITGGLGFIGKLLIEKLCRACSIKNIYVLIRPKKNISAQQRLLENLKDSVFELLYKEKPNFVTKIIPIQGDITECRLGLSDNDWNVIVNEVDTIFHLAANVRFDVEMKDAILCNVRGTRETLSLGKACKYLRSYVHVSTAYTHATTSRVGTLVREEFHACLTLPETMIKMAETMSEKKLNEITPILADEWPNTYTFSKSVAEEAVRTMAGDLPICVVKPAIVTATISEPRPGWVDMSNVYGPSGMILGLGMGIINILFAKLSSKINFNPADFVTNAIITAGWDIGCRPATEEKKIEIYTVSNIRNPITWGETGNIMRKSRFKIATSMAVWYCAAFETNSPFLYWLMTWLFHFIPAYIIDSICFLIGKERRFVKIYDKINKLTTVLSFFSRHDWQFCDDNLQRLFKKMSKTDQIIFNFDMTTVDWEKFITIWWIGLRKYIIKDGLEGTQQGNTKQKILCVVNYLMLILYLYIIFKIVSYAFIGCSLVLEPILKMFFNSIN